MPRGGPPRLEEEFLELASYESQMLIIDLLRSLHKKVDTLMAEIDDLNTAMDKMTTAVGSTVTELQKLADEIKQLSSAPGGVDPAAVEAAATKLSTLADNLNTAVTAAG